MEGRMVSKETRKKIIDADLKGKLKSYSKELIKELRDQIAFKRRDLIFKVPDHAKLKDRISQEYL
jgi:hypothetical protein